MSMYVVINNHGEWEGFTTHALCKTREDAWKAKRKLLKLKIGNRKTLKIVQVLPDVIYPYGINANDHVLIQDKKEPRQ